MAVSPLPWVIVNQTPLLLLLLLLLLQLLGGNRERNQNFAGRSGTGTADVYAAAGFVEEGLLRQAYQLPGGGRIDLILMSVLRADWIQQARLSTPERKCINGPE